MIFFSLVGASGWYAGLPRAAGVVFGVAFDEVGEAGKLLILPTAPGDWLHSGRQCQRTKIPFRQAKLSQSITVKLDPPGVDMMDDCPIRDSMIRSAVNQ